MKRRKALYCCAYTLIIFLMLSIPLGLLRQLIQYNWNGKERLDQSKRLQLPQWTICLRTHTHISFSTRRLLRTIHSHNPDSLILVVNSGVAMMLDERSFKHIRFHQSTTRKQVLSRLKHIYSNPMRNIDITVVIEVFLHQPLMGRRNGGAKVLGENLIIQLCCTKFLVMLEGDAHIFTENTNLSTLHHYLLNNPTGTTLPPPFSS